MSLTPGELRAIARRLDGQAAEVSAAADTLQFQHTFLGRRLQIVLDAHTPAVWQSRAADTSRLRIRYGVADQLERARVDLAELVASLRTKAESFENLADGNRRRALELEQAAAAAQQPFLPPHLRDDAYEPYVEPVSTGYWGVH